MTSVALSMIVKDEAAVIERCLRSLVPVVDHWTVVDTGSTDGTQDLVRTFLQNSPGAQARAGELVERPWVNFAHNRNEALELARPHGDYVLLPLATDLELVVDDGSFKERLQAPAYSLLRRHGIMTYWNTGLVRSDVSASYVGVTHEYLDSPPPVPLAGLWLDYHADGPERPGRYAENVRLLTVALADEHLSPFLRARYEFYLAQSYRDLSRDQNDVALALFHYAKRTQLGHWDQEVYLSHYYSGLLFEQSGQVDAALASYSRATEVRPDRNEARWAATKLLRAAGRAKEAVRVGAAGAGLPAPADGLFVLPWIYEHGLVTELRLAAADL